MPLVSASPGNGAAQRSVMRVTFDAMAARQCDRWSRRLAEAMLPVDRHSDTPCPRGRGGHGWRTFSANYSTGQRHPVLPKKAAPISLVQLGETLAMSIATVNRTLSDLRKSRTVDFQRGVLQIKKWERLAKLAQFNPSYLHLKKAHI